MLKLIRSYLDDCTIGKLFYRDKFICYTVERPWKNNEKNVSCIPAGIYDIEHYSSAKYPNSFALTCHDLGVGLTEKYHRTHCLIHPANFPDEVQGCIGPGLSLHPSTWGVASSRKAMDTVRELIVVNLIDQIEIK